MSGRNIVVVGGRGHVGRILVDGLLAAGAGVVAVTGNPDAWVPADDADLPRPWVVAAGTDRRAGAYAVRELGLPIHAVVAALGGWSLEGELLTLSLTDWRDRVESHLTSHLVAAQDYVPLLDAGSHSPYIMLNGAASRRPMADAASISVTGAAQAMLVRTLRAQPAQGRARFHEVVLMEAVSGDARNLTPAAELPAHQVVSAVRSVIEDPNAEASVTVEVEERSTDEG